MATYSLAFKNVNNLLDEFTFLPEKLITAEFGKSLAIETMTLSHGAVKASRFILISLSY